MRLMVQRNPEGMIGILEVKEITVCTSAKLSFFSYYSCQGVKHGWNLEK